VAEVDNGSIICSLLGTAHHWRRADSREGFVARGLHPGGLAKRLSGVLSA
jgi:hypothetical protein